MAESAQSMTQRYIAECEKYMDNRYYIYPPRAFMMKHLVRLWIGIFFLAVLSIGPLPFFFVPAIVMVISRYRPLFKLWAVYYSRWVLLLITLVIIAGSYMLAPLAREFFYNTFIAST